MGRHELRQEPAINRRGLIEPQLCSHPVGDMEWRRDEKASRWVGICQGCGRGRCMSQHYGQEPFAVTDEEIARGEFTVPFLYMHLHIPYEPW